MRRWRRYLQLTRHKKSNLKSTKRHSTFISLFAYMFEWLYTYRQSIFMVFNLLCCVKQILTGVLKSALQIKIIIFITFIFIRKLCHWHKILCSGNSFWNNASRTHSIELTILYSANIILSVYMSVLTTIPVSHSQIPLSNLSVVNIQRAWYTQWHISCYL